MTLSLIMLAVVFDTLFLMGYSLFCGRQPLFSINKIYFFANITKLRFKIFEIQHLKININFKTL